jgi:hypothetical protein
MRVIPKFKALLVVVIFINGFAEEMLAQEKNKQGKDFNIRKAKSAIKLDGILDEEEWHQADIATNFYMNFPVDTMAPQFQSEARVTFDQNFFYVSFVCYDNMEKPNIVQSMRRDFDFDLNDNIGVFIDPYNDNTNGFYFLITPFNVQQEGTIASGGSLGNSYNADWDNKWYSHVKRYNDKWIAELAIPFKSFRYNSKVSNWNITFLRHDLKHNQLSSWIAAPIQYIPASFAYSGKLFWDQPPPDPGVNISLIPYTTASTSKDSENAKETTTTGGFGFDAKVAVSPALNLDLTVNPDFSNVEVDRQVINLTRFEYQFPERRTFFLENSDLFSTPGYPDSRPFFSRRIGLVRDSSGNLHKVPIVYGARLSGKIGKNWRVGAMNMQTKKNAALGLPDQNYTLAVVQRQVFSRSNVDLFVVDKESLGVGPYDQKKYYHSELIHTDIQGTDTVKRLNLYNRVLGADFNLFTKSNRWNGDFYYHKSFDHFTVDKNYSHGLFLSYSSRNFNVYAGENAYGKNYNAEVGFVPGKAVYTEGYQAGFNRAEGRFYPKSGKITNMGPGVEVNYTIVPGGTMTDRSYIVDYSINYRNTARLMAAVRRIFQKLPSDFNPIDPKDNPSFTTGQQFEWTEYNLQFNSDSRKVYTYTARLSGGQFYNGKRMGIGGTFSYRYQPYGNITLTYDYNELQFPAPYKNARFLLLSPRADLTFTNKIFFTTFIQYNTRYDNVNLNARFQWRFRPASDLFLVYTENYLPEHLRSKNRALVLKFTYWINL